MTASDVPRWRERLGALRRRWRRLMRPPRRLKFTRAGRWYTGLSIAIGIAAINTGNNLLFLLLGLLLAGIVLSGVLSEWVLRGVRIERVLPVEARAGQPVLVGLRVRNEKGRLGSFALVLRDVTTEGEAGRAFVLRLDPGESREVSYRWTPRRRGRVVFERLEVATRYPFGFFEKWREVDAMADVVVFPRPVPPPPLSLRRASPHGERPASTIGVGHEFFALRDATDRDDARHIHWRTSARRGRPVVVEREKESRRRVVVRLDNRHAAEQGAASLDGPVEEAAALVERLLDGGCEVGFVASGVTVSPSAGPVHQRRLLRVLALLEPAVGGAAPERVPRADVLEVVPSERATTEAA